MSPGTSKTSSPASLRVASLRSLYLLGILASISLTIYLTSVCVNTGCLHRYFFRRFGPSGATKLLYLLERVARESSPPLLVETYEGSFLLKLAKELPDLTLMSAILYSIYKIAGTSSFINYANYNYYIK
jgi:hypothetical protein